jgi:hypothetical protein
MTRTLLGILLLALSSTLSAQLRFDLGIAGGVQQYERGTDADRKFLFSPEAHLSRGRLTLYYALDYTELSSAGPMYASHFGLAYRWPLGDQVAFSAGAGPSYVTVEQLGGEVAWNAQAELALRTRRLEWFAKVRHYDYTLEEFRIANASPDGPAVLGGVRVTLWP